jgi:hypothetical protein
MIINLYDLPISKKAESFQRTGAVSAHCTVPTIIIIIYNTELTNFMWNGRHIHMTKLCTSRGELRVCGAPEH